MSIRKTCKSLVGVMLLGTVLAGSYAVWWWWTYSDEHLRQEILATCAEIAPEWDVRIGRARFDLRKQIHIYDVSLRADPEGPPIVNVPEVIVIIDGNQLASRQQVLVHRVRLIEPKLELSRDSAGVWNWQALPPIPQSNRSLPELTIEDASVKIGIDHGRGLPPGTLAFRNSGFQLVPSAKRRYDVRGLADVESIGRLKIQGDIDVKAKLWNITGELNDLEIGPDVFQWAAGFSPAAAERLAGLMPRLPPTQTDPQPPQEDHEEFSRSAQLAMHPHRPIEVRATSVQQHRPDAGATRGFADLGVTAEANVSFSIARPTPADDIQYDVQLQISKGQITNALLPVSLQAIGGRILCDNEQVLLRDFTASSGLMHLDFEGSIVPGRAGTPGRFRLQARDLELDDRFRERLPEQLRILYDEMQPEGRFDLQVDLNCDEIGAWRYNNLVLAPKGCSATHAKFPYPIRDIFGTVKQRGRQFDIALRGRAGRRPVELNGFVRNPGPEAHCDFTMEVKRLPLDDMFQAACAPAVRKTLTSLDLKGHADITASLVRPPGPDQQFQLQLEAGLHGGSLRYKDFPYRVTDITGTISFIDDVWTISNFRGVHDGAEMSASGMFVAKPGAEKLDLMITADGGNFDKPLELALAQTQPMQHVWEQISPRGRLDTIIRVQWQPEAGLKVTIPKLRLVNAELTLKAWPYPLEKVNVEVKYESGRLDIGDFTAWHGDTQMRGRGFAEFGPEGDWRIRFEEFSIDDLDPGPDRPFRRALPDSLRTAIDNLNPRGLISLKGMVDFRGVDAPNYPVTAAWDLNIICTKNTLSAGVELENISGRISSHGTWDGQRLDTQGDIELTSLWVLDHQLSRISGPFSLDEHKVVVGSLDRLLSRTARTVSLQSPIHESITAHAIDGIIMLDAAVTLEREPTYRAKVALSRGRLEAYAAQYIADPAQLRGLMNGWVEVWGKGTSKDSLHGRGQLQISPAALYQMPLIVSIFNVLRFAPPDSAAFKYVFLDFEIGDSRFKFNIMDLIGDAISLHAEHGKSYIRFDGTLHLDFFSRLPPNQIRIPLVDLFIDEATRGWVGVEVRGTTTAPRVTRKAFPHLDDAMKRLLKGFENRATGGLPSLLMPPLAPAPLNIIRPPRPAPPRIAPNPLPRP